LATKKSPKDRIAERIAVQLTKIEKAQDIIDAAKAEIESACQQIVEL